MTRVPDAGFPVEIVAGVPVVTTCEEIDVTNAARPRAHKRAQAAGGEVLLVISTATVRHIFALTRLDQVIPCFQSLGKRSGQPGSEASGRLVRSKDFHAERGRLLHPLTAQAGPGFSAGPP